MVFAPMGRFLTDSGLYIPVHGWKDYSTAKPVFIIQQAKDCSPETSEIAKGTKAFVSDGFELVESKDLWEFYRDEPEFATLRSLIDKYGGKVKTAIVNELALLAVETQ